MKYYTKEWYTLMQHQNDTCGLTPIPDKDYSDQEIRAFYEADLNEEIARDRELHNTPPDFSWIEALLQPERFSPETFLFEDPRTGELFHPQTAEIARMHLECDRRQQETQFAKRPPFDPSETIACFRECYRNMLRYGGTNYPQWVQDTVDMRLLALHRMPERAFYRLQLEEQENRRAFERIEAEAAAVLKQQDIPETIRSKFCFHDANLLSLRKKRSDVELYLRKDGGWFGDCTPYIKLTFHRVRKLDREKGFALRRMVNADGELTSSCWYLYDELYRTDTGYEVHMLLYTRKSLRYLTVCCENISFEDNLDPSTVWREVSHAAEKR